MNYQIFLEHPVFLVMNLAGFYYAARVLARDL